MFISTDSKKKNELSIKTQVVKDEREVEDTSLSLAMGEVSTGSKNFLKIKAERTYNDIPLFTLEIFRAFIYKSYITFFVEGVRLHQTCYVLDSDGEVQLSDNFLDHHPQLFSQYRLSSYIREVLSVNDWKLTSRDIADIVSACMSDFDGGFGKYLPTIVRVHTSSTGKQKAYNALFPRLVYFEPLLAPEVQSIDPTGVILAKMEEAENSLSEAEDALSVVDDVGLECEALGGFPGPYVKDFIHMNTPREITTILGTRNKVHVTFTVGLVARIRGKIYKSLASIRVPGLWNGVPMGIGFGFDPFVYIGKSSLADQPQWRAAALYWAWHRVRLRIKSDAAQ